MFKQRQLWKTPPSWQSSLHFIHISDPLSPATSHVFFMLQPPNQADRDSQGTLVLKCKFQARNIRVERLTSG